MPFPRLPPKRGLEGQRAWFYWIERCELIHSINYFICSVHFRYDITSIDLYSRINKKIMIPREYRTTKLILVFIVAVVVVWKGKNNLAWFASEVYGRKCTTTLLLIECER